MALIVRFFGLQRSGFFSKTSLLTDVKIHYLLLSIEQKIGAHPGGVRQIFAEGMLKICFGHDLVPTCKFFPNSQIFSSIFLGPTKFFPRMQFFSTENLGPTYFLSDNEIFTAENMGPTHIPTPKNRHSIITKCR